MDIDLKKATIIDLKWASHPGRFIPFTVIPASFPRGMRVAVIPLTSEMEAEITADPQSTLPIEVP